MIKRGDCTKAFTMCLLSRHGILFWNLQKHIRTAERLQIRRLGTDLSY